MSYNKPQRDLSFDYLKGVLIILVVWGHLITFITNSDGTNLTPSQNILGTLIYTFHMPLFVFVSGYFFNNNTSVPFLSIIKKQFRRLLVPELVMDIIGFLLIFIFWSSLNFILCEDSIFSIKKICHYITSEWFLWCIFFVSIFCNVIKRLFKTRYKIALFTILLLLLLFQKYFPGVIFHNQQFIKQAPFFALGMLYRSDIPILRYKNVLLSAAFVIAVFYFYNNILNGSLIEFGIVKEFVHLAYLIIAYFIIKAVYRYSVLKPFICKLGLNTLGIYIFSNYFLSFVLKSNNFTISHSSVIVSDIIALIFACIICACITGLNYLIRKENHLKMLLLGE